jgi:HSP20 family protein
VPGRNKENFRLELENKILSVSYQENEKASSQNETYLLRGFHPEAFNRWFEIPEAADRDNIQANYQNGILSIRIPKKRKKK